LKGNLFHVPERLAAERHGCYSGILEDWELNLEQSFEMPGTVGGFGNKASFFAA
jgi:hypothetical protein